MTRQPIVSREKWTEARKTLLAKEKQLTRQHDEIARQRRELPWVKVEEKYVFDAPEGNVTLADLFKGKSQLFIYHFMFGPDWKEGCPSCSYICDHIGGAVPHMAARDVSLVMISRAPISKIEAFKKRMGWSFPWVSSSANNFNHDFGVYFTPEEFAKGEVYYNYKMQKFPGREAPGASVFYKDPQTGEIFHTYSTYGRGLDAFVGTYTMLDMVPKGRDEDDLPFDMVWVRHHDRYGTSLKDGFLDKDRPFWPPVADDAVSDCCHGAGTQE